MSVSLNPIAPWWLLSPLALGVVAISLVVYFQNLRGGSGLWRYACLSLRMLAIVLCLSAALRPSLLVLRKQKVDASIVVLTDASKSMTIADQAGGATRWDAARKALVVIRDSIRRYAPGIDVKYYRFGGPNDALADDRPEDTGPPGAVESALGNGITDAAKNQSGTKLVAEIVLSDGANNAGRPPLLEGAKLVSQQVPIVAVGFGLETAGSSSKDVSVRELKAGPTVFVKQELQVEGTIGVRGYANETIEVELLAEDEDRPVMTRSIKVKPGDSTIAVRDLKWTPKKAGEKKVTLRVRPKDGELLTGNNEVGTFVTVLGGGLNVLYIQASRFSWELRFLTRALDASDRIRVDTREVRLANQIDNNQLAPDAYDAIILGDVPAEFLTRVQQELLVRFVEQGGGLLMLGGRRSFGVGGWGSTRVADLLPVKIHPGDGQIDPKGGVKVVPNVAGIESYVTRLAPERAESLRIWSELPPISGYNRVSGLKENAILLASTPGPNKDPLMIGGEYPRGRVLAFLGETWPWARKSDESRAAHRRLWRQSILWLCHKENQDETQVQLAIDRRRVAVGDKLDITASARDGKGEALADVKYSVTVEPVGVPAPGKPAPKPEPVSLFNQGLESRGPYYAGQAPGDYRVVVRGTRDGKDLGTASARFLVFQDDRELENPAADLVLLRQLAELTGGQMLPPENLDGFLKTLKSEVTSEYVKQEEIRIWDNWGFLVAFVVVLTGEWWLRKRHGWV